MTEFLTYAIPGVPQGCVYALVAAGLVLTFKTSGVFNLAFGAQAYASAAIFYVTVEERDWSEPLAFLVAVVVAGPLLGLLLDQALFRHMRTAPTAVKLVSGLGLLVGIPAVVRFALGQKSRLAPPELWLTRDRIFRIDRYTIDGHELVTVCIVVAMVVALALVFRFTALGLKMRAVVESPRMVQLAGINAEGVATFAWVLSSFMAALAGVLLAPFYANLDETNFTVLLAAAIAAAAFGRLSSLPLTLAGGVLLGVGQQVLAGYLPPASILARGIRPAFPFIVLVVLLLVWPGLRRRRETEDPLAACDPPPPALAATFRDEALERVNRIAFPIFLLTFLVVSLFFVSSYWLFLLTQALVYTTIFLSITVLTGMSGQLSLCQGTFAAVGAFTAGQLAERWEVSFFAGMLVGGVIAAIVGAVVALPALRLGGLYLALGTLAFALMADFVLFPLEWVGGSQAGVSVPRPTLGSVDFTANRAMFLLALAVFAVAAIVVILVRKGTTGRYLAAMRGSELAAVTIGINPVRAKITVFALSAAIAGVGGALLGSVNQKFSVFDFPFFLSLVFMVLVLSTGSRTVEGAVNAGMAFVLLQELLTRNELLGVIVAIGGLAITGSAVSRGDRRRVLFGVLFLGAGLAIFVIDRDYTALQYALFGYGAVNFAKHPEGIVEAKKRQSIENMLEGRRLRAERRLQPASAGG